MSFNEISQFEQRKQDHIDLALKEKNQASNHNLDKLILVHEAIPDLDFAEIDISVQSLNIKFTTPFFVSSMTAGHKGAININSRLAEACSHTAWAMGVGSQRRELLDTTATNEWQEINKQFPELQLYGNIGITQLIATPINMIKKLCENIQAKALFIHCNSLQECIQPEGTPQFRGGYQAIEKLCSSVEIPIIIKETGCGFSINTLQRLMNLGVAAVDVSGYGGTHWGRIEGDRTKSLIQKHTAESFNDWGISTLDSILNAKKINPHYEIWASGGIRSGLDAAKYLALGAKRIGIAKPMLEAALINTETVIETMQTFEYQLRTALFCTGSKDHSALQEKHRWQLTI